MANERTGRVVALCKNTVEELRKNPCECTEVTDFGIEGDRHCGPTRKNHKTGLSEPNDRQITILANEVLADLHRTLGARLYPGDLGENILVEGLGDLSDLRGGELLEFSQGVQLAVTGQNDPCRKIAVYHPRLVKVIYGRRGVTAVVRSVGFTRMGDGVKLLPAGEQPPQEGA